MEEQYKNNKINTPIQSMVESAQKDSTIGPMIGSIIVILLILMGGLYFLSTLVATKKSEVETQQVLEEQNEAAQVEETAEQSKSDEVHTIEADIKATDIGGLDKKISEIEKEF